MMDIYYPCGAHVSEGDRVLYEQDGYQFEADVLYVAQGKAKILGRFGKRLKGMDRKLRTAIVSPKELQLMERTQ